MKYHVKIALTLAFAIIAATSCSAPKPTGYVIADSKGFEASLFRQHCAICHGPEAEGKSLPDGKQVPSLRKGEFKFKTEAEIRKQISEGGNGMLPFRDQLTAREIDMLVSLVHNDLRR